MQTRKLGGIASLILLLTACASGNAGSGSSVWTSPLPPLMTPTTDNKAETATETVTTKPAKPPAADQARLRARRSQLAADAERLLQLAEDYEGHEQQKLLLQAAENAQLAGRDHLAAEALDRLEELEPLVLNPEEAQRLVLVHAEMGAYASRPLTLLKALPAPQAQQPSSQAARIWRLRSEAYLALGQILPATQALVKRESALRTPAAIEANRDLIWRTLRSVPPGAMNARQLASTDPITRGWIALAQIMLDLWLSPSELTASVNNWERLHPNHPARSTVLASSSTRGSVTTTTGKRRKPVRITGDGQFNKIALLLPLSGAYATPAKAVRDGFMVNYYARSQPRPDVLVYDTAGNPANLPNLVNQAITAGADILVGPLTKQAVERMATLPDVSVPVLTLNYLDDELRAPANTYQFGLSPEDEARQAAARALRDGHFRALALVPRNDWGLRTLTAFNDELHKLGGSLVEYVYYNPADRDFSAPITQMLRYNRQRAASIDAAQKRRRSTNRENAGSVTPLSAIRQDFDFIFLASKPEQARLIRPQLRFYRASAVPVYATSHVFSGTVSAQQDLDLDGIQFGDAPWTLAPAGAMADARAEVARLWPASHARYPRLYAMGYDAYALATQLAKGNLRSDFGFPGATGLLTLQSDGRISRGLQWARFGGGKPRLLSDTVMQPFGADAAF